MGPAAWDAIGSEFASRHELYEINYAGSYEQGQLDACNDAKKTGLMKKMTGFVETCMDEYDEKSWKTAGLIDPQDISVVS
jgi:4-hydroxyphenylacetate 3-monooxygenase